MKKIIRLSLIAILFIFSVGNAHAGFLGNTMEVHQYAPPTWFFGPGGTYDSKTFEVDDSVELPSFGANNQGSIDVSDNNILIRFSKDDVTISFLSEYYYVFQDINSNFSDITDVRINPSSGGFMAAGGSPTEFDSSRITYHPDDIYIDFVGLDVDKDTLLSLDVSFRAVPIPSGVWLLGSGLVALIGWRLRIKRRFFGDICFQQTPDGAC